MAHEILVRQNRPAAAELWQQALADRTAETADANLARFEELCEQYGVRLPSVAERLAERFTRPARHRPRAGPRAAGDGRRRRLPIRPICRARSRNRKPGPRAGRSRPRRARLALRPRRRSLDGPLREAARRNERRAPAADRAGPAQLGRIAAANRQRRRLGSFCRLRLHSAKRRLVASPPIAILTFVQQQASRVVFGPATSGKETQHVGSLRPADLDRREDIDCAFRPSEHDRD